MASQLFPKTPRVHQIRVNGFDLVVWLNEHIGRRLVLTRSFESEEIAQYEMFIKPGNVCVDVGANIGLHSLHFARLCGSTGRVDAFEPVARNALLIQLNAELNGLAHVKVICSALSDKAGLELSPVRPTADSTYTFFARIEGRDKGETVKSLTLDDYCADANLKAVHFLKVDVEGAEMRVLEGSERVLSTYKPVVMVEIVEQYLQRFGDSTAALCEMMAGYGYIPQVLRHGRLVRATAAGIDCENVFFLQIE